MSDFFSVDLFYLLLRMLYFDTLWRTFNDQMSWSARYIYKMIISYRFVTYRTHSLRVFEEPVFICNQFVFSDCLLFNSLFTILLLQHEFICPSDLIVLLIIRLIILYLPSCNIHLPHRFIIECERRFNNHIPDPQRL